MTVLLVIVGLVVFLAGRIAANLGASSDVAIVISATVFMFLLAVNVIVGYRLQVFRTQLLKDAQEIVRAVKAAKEG